MQLLARKRFVHLIRSGQMVKTPLQIDVRFGGDFLGKIRCIFPPDTNPDPAVSILIWTAAVFLAR